MSLSQLLFILDIDNYKYDFNIFRLNFQKCDNSISVSEELCDMFKRNFGFKLVFSKNENMKPINLFEHAILSNEDFFIVNSSFNNCVPSNHIDFIYNLEKLKKNNINNDFK